MMIISSRTIISLLVVIIIIVMRTCHHAQVQPRFPSAGPTAFSCWASKKNIHAREYQLYLPSKEELQQKLTEPARKPGGAAIPVRSGHHWRDGSDQGCSSSMGSSTIR